MSGSVTDSDACGTDWEKWIPQIDSTKGECNFSWRPPWKNFRIKLCSKDNKVLDNTSGYLVPLKMQFLMTHHLATIQKIIRNLESSTVESINATEELLEIKVKSLECEDIFTEIDRVLAREIDDIVMKPIQRLEFTSNLVEELFDQELKEKSIDLMRDETNIFIVGFEKMKSFITKNIDVINRVTVSKVVKLEDKWKIEAVRCFEIVETLSRTFTDVVVRLQEDNSCVYLKGRDVTISKAEKEVHKLFSDLFNEKLRVDPLILKLLICKEASELFKDVLQKDNLQVVWTVDQSHLYFVSKTQIDTDALTAVVYKTFLTTGFCKSSQYKNLFCNSNVFTKITKQHTNKLLFLETTKTSVNIAGTKSLIFLLLHQEKLFYNKAGNTKEIQAETLSYEVAGIKDEKMKVDLQVRELEVKLDIETQKNKKTNDQYLSLVRKCREEEEKFKRIIHEKELLLNESKVEKANFTKQLSETKTDSRTSIVNILTREFLDNEEDRISIRYVLETKFEEAKEDLDKKNISLYKLPDENGEMNYFAKPDSVFRDFKFKIYDTLHGFRYGLKTIKKHYPESYYSTYSSSEINLYRAENIDGIWIVGKKEDVNKICQEIEREISRATMDTRFSTDIRKVLPVSETVNISGDEKKREYCKHHFTLIHHTIENSYNVSFTEKENQSGRYGWIVEGDPQDVQAAVKELSDLVKNVCTKVKIYKTDDRRKIIQEYVDHLTKNTYCRVTTEENKSTWIRADLDLRTEILCYEWKFPSSNYIQIINAEDGRLLCKESVVFHIQVKDKPSLGDCFYHQESSAVILYIPAWKSEGKEKHTVFSILDSFYKKKPSEKPKSDMPLVLFLSEPTKQGWPYVKFMKVFLLAWSSNCVLSPLYILEPNRETFERTSEVVHDFAAHTSRQPRIKITVKIGEMAKLKSDAIVNSANENLTLNNGVVSKSILFAAGQQIQDECTEIMRHRRHKQLDSNEVVVSGGHNLNCRYVFHGSLASWGSQTLAEFVYNCLREADLRELSSISFPSLGTGNRMYPPDDVAAIMFKTVQNFGITRTIHNLKVVDFVIYEKDSKALMAFRTAENRFKKGIVKEEKWLKCPNPQTVKVMVTADSESTVIKTFSMIEENLKTNTKIGGAKDERMQ